MGIKPGPKGLQNPQGNQTDVKETTSRHRVIHRLLNPIFIKKGIKKNTAVHCASAVLFCKQESVYLI